MNNTAERKLDVYIGELQGLTFQELQERLFDEQLTPVQDQDPLMQQALVTLLERSDPAPQEEPDLALVAYQALHTPKRKHTPVRHRRLRRTMVAAALFISALLMAASAFPGLFVWLETVYEQFTQIHAAGTAQEEVDRWAGVYLPAYLPPSFTISDAMSTEDVKVIEYADTQGDRITFYQYSPDANVRIDTEAADKTEASWLNDGNAYLVHKGDLDTVYWEIGDCILSVEYNPDAVPVSEIKAFTVSIQWRQGSAA